MKRPIRNGFTPDKQVELLKNPYTRSVSAGVIKFTDEFNELFIKRHSQGIGPSMIFKDCGYDLTLLGERRVTNYYNRLRNSYEYQHMVAESHLSQTESTVEDKYANMSPLMAMEAMQHEIKYLRQEVEFLKKIVSLVNRKKQGC